MRNYIIISLIFAMGLTSCYNDSEEALFPQSQLKSCDTSVFTFSGAIKPMIDGNCISCHASQAPVLNSYDAVVLNASTILTAIKRQGSIIAMPPTSTLEDCKVTQFQKWINAGKKNN